MLDPQNRRLLLETLRPPAGFELDQAIGTTYSLDLLALLAAPLAFSLFADGDEPQADPLVLLEALQANADRITVFCDAGHIYVPPADRLLFAHLERSVVEAIAPHGGAFHPKIWLLRYTNETETAYRFVCLSRNLTFDRSWDTAVVLDGRVKGRPKRNNAPLSRFIGRLPDLARNISSDRAATVRRLAAEVRRVEWERPDPFEELLFVPLGHDAKPSASPFSGSRIDRLLVVSPFPTTTRLDRLTPEAGRDILISRADALDGCGAELLSRFTEVLVLQDEASPDDDNTGALRGLHAKLYVADQGWNATVWSGSANATSAAFEQNVEFLVEMRGLKSKVGIDATLRRGSGSNPGLRDLLTEYQRGDAPSADEQARQALERQGDLLRRCLASAELQGELRSDPSDLWSLTLTGPPIVLPADVHDLVAWPVTLRGDAYHKPFAAGETAHAAFEQLATHQITPFVAFAATLRRDAFEVPVSFVLNIALVGDPADRRASITRALLHDRATVMRYLLYLLAGNGLEAMRALAGPTGEGGDGTRPASGGPGIPLLESLMRTLDRDPRRLAAIRRIVDDLQRGDKHDALLPDGWTSVWDAVSEVAAEVLT
ncbi:MAG: phospholipase D family protein [Solirubrobacteraceae bacterium]